MISININGTKSISHKNTSIIEACKFSGIQVLRFCFHEILPIAGNCRACLVEIENLEKPVASCVTDIESNLNIWTTSIFSIKARENVLELLLLNHPLDCPICDQAGECDLQDQTKSAGSFSTRFFFKKRGVSDKNSGFYIKTIMTRCIHCTRCVRFNNSLGEEKFGVLNRGTNSEIGFYSVQNNESNLISNVIDLCPVGALTARVYSFQSRPWELKIIEGLDLIDGLGSNIYLNYKDSEVLRIMPKPNSLLNGSLISDNCRFSFDGYKNNRIQHIFECNHQLKYSKLTWYSFLNKANVLPSSFVFLITEELDLLNLLFLKKLSNKYCHKIKINLLNKKITTQNFYLFNSFTFVRELEKSKICLLISANPYLECVILNFYIKIKYQKKLFSIFCLGRFFISNVQIHFLNLNINSLLLLFEAKLNKITSLILFNVNSLVLFGESFCKKIWNIDFFINHFYLKFPAVKFLKINLFCNEEGINFLNINNIMGYNKTFFCINSQDTLQMRKYVLNKKTNLIWWFNTHRPFLVFSVKYLIPLITSVEAEYFYLNLEQKIQKTQKIFSSCVDSRPLIKILESLFFNKKTNISDISTFFNTLFETVQNQIFFTNLKKNYFSLKTPKAFKTMLSLYPIKTMYTESTLNSSILVNSKHIQNNRRIKKLYFTNFNLK